ncbi:MAG: lipopolysaccharide biosynthesis protein [Bacteroidetes bacterium]|nr:lipopolysaccharide biosynthesis protein [Bacteroidota bacterium]
MSEQSLKQKATKGVLWSFVDQFATQGISFLVGIILARILLPSDYGLIGMLSIFIAIASSLTESGFTQALVQKTDRTEADFSTVFYSNLGIAIIIYIVLYFASPWIAGFYNAPQLESITKVFAIIFVINSLYWVPRTKLMIKVDFKTQSKISVISVIISGIFGITLAYTGFGVWTLVWQNLIHSVCQIVLFWFYYRWKPNLIFSKESYRRLFGYGSKIMASGLLNNIYNNIYMMVIGKVYSASDLGYYSRAYQLQTLPTVNITTILLRVTFPILCSIQNEEERFMAVYRKLIRMVSFITFPLMFLLVTIAKPLVVILITEKWLPAVDLFQILCFAGMWYPIHTINLNILEAKGRSDLFFKVEVQKKIFSTIVLVATIPFSLKTMVLGQAFSSFACLFFNTYYTGKFFNYGITEQIKDIAVFLLIAICICAVTMFTIQNIDSYLLQLIAGILMYTGIYVFLSKLLKIEELEETKKILIMPLQKIFKKSQ